MASTVGLGGGARYWLELFDGDGFMHSGLYACFNDDAAALAEAAAALAAHDCRGLHGVELVMVVRAQRAEGPRLVGVRARGAECWGVEVPAFLADEFNGGPVQ